MSRLADTQVGQSTRQQPFRLVTRGVNQAQTNVAPGHGANQRLQQRSGGKGIVGQGNILRGAIRHFFGKGFKGFDLAHQQVRLTLQLFPLRRQLQAATLTQKQRIPQTIFKELNQIAKRRAVLAQLARRFRQAFALNHSGEGFQLGKRIHQGRHCALHSVIRGDFPP